MTERPTLPPLFFVAGSLWLVCALGLRLLEGLSASFAIACVVCGGCVVLVCLYMSLRRSRLLWYVGLGAALGCACAGQGAYTLSCEMQNVYRAESQHYRIQIREDVHESDFGLYTLGKAYASDGSSFYVRVNFPEDKAAPCWYMFDYEGSIRKPSEQAQSYYWSKNCVGSISPKHLVAHRPQGIVGLVCALRASAGKNFAGESTGHAFMRSIILGDRTDFLTSPVYGRVKRAGLAHMVAVSGAHLSVAVTVAGLVLAAIRMPRGFVSCVQIGLCVAFVFLTGAPHSAMRACVMTLCALSAYFVARRPFALNALSLCIVVFICLQPFLVFSVSLLLSAAATLGIILFSRYFSCWLALLSAGRAKSICDILGMTLAAISTTVPISACAFGQFSLIAPVSNLCAAPLFTFLCAFGMLAGLLPAWVPGASLFVSVMVEAGEMFCQAVDVLARIPYAATVISVSPVVGGLASCVLGAALLYWWPKPGKLPALCTLAALIVTALVVLFVIPRTHGAELVMLDVGQGDAILARSGSQAVLVDTGTNDSDVLKGLASHDIHRLDALLISHPDDDHCGSVPAVLDFVEVDRVLVATDLLACTCTNCTRLRNVLAGYDGLAVEGLRATDTFVWGCFQAEVLSPDVFRDSGGNDDSLVLELAADVDFNGTCDARALLTGDAESEVLNRIDKRKPLHQVDIFKVGHHGSQGAVSAEQIDILNPSIALVSVGASNRYGHPTQETLDVLQDAGVTVFRSDKSGDVVCKLFPGEIVVQVSR